MEITNIIKRRSVIYVAVIEDDRDILEETWPHLISCKQSGEGQLDRTDLMNGSGGILQLQWSSDNE